MFWRYAICSAVTRRSRNRYLALAGSLLLLVFVATGCNQAYQVKVDGIRDGRVARIAGRPYKLLVPPKGAAGASVNQARVESMIKTALATHGYYPVDSESEADLVITVEYGLTPGRVSFRQRAVLRTPNIGVYDAGYRNYPGIVPVVSHEQEIVKEVVKTKYITFSARDPRAVDRTGKPVEIWNLVVKIEDEGENLDEYIPILLAGSMKYLGENTGEQIELTVAGDSEAVQYVVNDATFDKSAL